MWMFTALTVILLCLYHIQAEISYLQVSSEEINSSEYGLKDGKKGTTCPCGWSNRNGARIIGKRTAQSNEFPFVAGIVDKYTGYLFCGGTLVTNSHVITGAHCTWRRRVEGDPIAVVLGEHDVRKDSTTRLTVDVRRIIEHQNFHRVQLVNDIAVLVLQEKVTFNQFIGPACLPTERKNLDHKYVRLIGWGSINQDGENSPVLKKVDLRVVPLKTCSYNYPGQVNPAVNNQICTFGRRKGTCQGDSGGPVLWLDPDTNRYTLIGTVSFGKNCASTIPTVNTDVFAYLDWIKRTIEATDREANTCAKKD
uniref:Venom s1 protease 12 n=1 Tax=Pristhesancus plagipennis TaxID=1955184 RepID=A0A1Q1NPF5_PRIPG|nr:venom s1 protease 12 [Pristhesancus plagipennis]